MLVVETIAKIRRAYFGQGKPIKAICRELNVSRKVVRKVIRTGATEFRYERESQPQPKIGPGATPRTGVLRPPKPMSRCRSLRARPTSSTGATRSW